MAGMGVMSRAIDKLPQWVKVVLGFIGIVGSIYLIAHEGFWSFILHLIFSPVV
jgi:hypothetical protein